MSISQVPSVSTDKGYFYPNSVTQTGLEGVKAHLMGLGFPAPHLGYDTADPRSYVLFSDDPARDAEYIRHNSDLFHAFEVLPVCGASEGTILLFRKGCQE